MKQAKLLREVKICGRDNRVERVIPEGTILRVGRIMGDAVYTYFGVASDPVLFPKEDLEMIDA